jgi:hypothetical protein
MAFGVVGLVGMARYVSMMPFGFHFTLLHGLDYCSFPKLLFFILFGVVVESIDTFWEARD